MHPPRLLTASLALAALALGAGCSDEKNRAAQRPSTPPAATPAVPSGGHDGVVIVLGDASIGGFAAHATRDEGAIVAGTDAPIDVTVKPTAASSARVAAVRFWIGLEDGKASVKAKADIENPAEPDRWHTHAEIPDPIPAGSKLWVEIESADGTKATGWFELKA